MTSDLDVICSHPLDGAEKLIKTFMAPEKSAKSHILIIDDDEQIRRLLKDLLSPDHDCTTVESAEGALTIMRSINFNLVISDINMGEISGLDLVPRILAQAPDTVVVMISGQQTIDFAIDAMRAGAFDYITKPLDIRLVETAVKRALAHHSLLVKQRRYENHLEELVRERTARIEHLAYHDSLTGLPNRLLFADRCAQALALAHRNLNLVAVMLVSLDRFKKIAESLGHAAGDVVLAEAASRLQCCVAQGDTVAHFDGDEFALLLTSVSQTAELAEITRAISEAFKAPFTLGDQQVYVSTSTGISLFPFNGTDGSTITRNAVAALYRAKKQGGNNYQFYAADMNSLALKRLEMETSMQRALENREFVVYYQPVINLASGEVVGSEALVRWQHPELGLLPPSRFIGLAEDTGLIMDIGWYVMREACVHTRLWQDLGFGRLRIAINISARHFQQRDFVPRLVEVLDETKLDPTSLELELTETSIMENPESAAKLLGEIRNLGVTVAIDDFGTGYSSLSYLKRLPIDTVKLDRSFVMGATTDQDDAALVVAIITLAHNLRLKVIAEGVETEDQVAFLRFLRCDEAQGFLFSKPTPPDLFEVFLADNPTGGPRQLGASSNRNANVAYEVQ